LPTQATIAITPGSGQFLDAVTMTIGVNTVVRETMVIADPTNPTSLAGVTVGGALLVDGSATTWPVSGTITANQGTSPWVIAGNLTHNNAAPIANEIGALVGLANAAAPTYSEGKQVLLSTDLTGALRVTVGAVIASNNITEWNSVALGSPSAYGTGPGAINVIGVNAFITNTPAVTLASTTITGTVAVTQSTSPWVVSNGGTFAVQASITTLGQQLAAASVPVVLTAAQISTLTPLPTVAVTQSTSPWVVAGGGTAGTAATGVVTVQGIAAMTPLLVTATFSAPQHVIVDSGTIAVTQSTSPWVVSLTSTTITGTVAVTQSTSPWVVSNGGTFAVQEATLDAALIAQEATTSGIKGLTVFGAVTTGAPTYTTGKSDALSLDVAGNLRVLLNAETTKVIGVTRTADGAGNLITSNSTTPAAHFALDTNITSILGTAPTTAGFLDIKGADGNIFVRQTTGTNLHVVLDTTSTTAVTQSTASNLNAQVQGTAADGAVSVGNPVLIAGFDGTAIRMISTDGAGDVQVGAAFANVDGQSNNTAYITKTANGLSVYPSVFNGTTWDRARSAAVGNAVATTGLTASAAYGEYLTTAPAPTTGQYSALQTDNAGSLFVKNTRRSQTVAQGTTITTSTAATAVTATPAANTFADLSQLIITVTPIAVTAIAFTATLSDGTNTYIYDIDTGVIATGGGDVIIVNFNPPLPATSAATGWTIALSVNTVVAHITTVVILQKAS
jgi:hypothetical protein